MVVCTAAADSTELIGLHVIFPSTKMGGKKALVLSRSEELQLEKQPLFPENCFLRNI